MITRDETMEFEISPTEADVGILVLMDAGSGSIANLLPVEPVFRRKCPPSIPGTGSHGVLQPIYITP